MNHITIKCDPIFYLNMEIEDINLLLELARASDDIAHKQTVVSGGFIRNWHIELEQAVDKKHKLVMATVSQLHMLLDILEFKRPTPIDKKYAIDKLCGHIKTAMQIANQKMKQIEFCVVEYAQDERVKKLRDLPINDDGSHYASTEEMLNVYHIPQFGLQEKK